MTRCASTAELLDGNMRPLPGMILTCQLEEGHDTGTFPRVDERGYVAEPTPHSFTFTWDNPTPDSEVLDPHEAFDLEVEIAPDDVIADQEEATLGWWENRG